jgi:hypothetical protein
MIEGHDIFDSFETVVQAIDTQWFHSADQPHVHEKEGHSGNVVGMEMGEDEIRNAAELDPRLLQPDVG